MNESEIKSKLDKLANFQAHRDLLESDKRALLDDVKVPAEVEAIVSAGMKHVAGPRIVPIIHFQEISHV